MKKKIILTLAIPMFFGCCNFIATTNFSTSDGEKQMFPLNGSRILLNTKDSQIWYLDSNDNHNQSILEFEEIQKYYTKVWNLPGQKFSNDVTASKVKDYGNAFNNPKTNRIFEYDYPNIIQRYRNNNFELLMVRDSSITYIDPALDGASYAARIDLLMTKDGKQIDGLNIYKNFGLEVGGSYKFFFIKNDTVFLKNFSFDETEVKQTRTDVWLITKSGFEKKHLGNKTN